MKGVVFTEFLEMVEDRFSVEAAERVVRESGLSSAGAYTSVGTYDHHELLRMVARLAELTGNPAPELVRAFGKHLFGRFVATYPYLFEGVASAFDFLAHVEDYIHVEVRKLYREAELPHFEVRRIGPHCLELTYRSQRPLADLAEGLIEGCAEYFGAPLRIRREDLPGGSGASTRFVLQYNAEVLQCST